MTYKDLHFDRKQKETVRSQTGLWEGFPIILYQNSHTLTHRRSVSSGEDSAEAFCRVSAEVLSQFLPTLSTFFYDLPESQQGKYLENPVRNLAVTFALGGSHDLTGLPSLQSCSQMAVWSSRSNLHKLIFSLCCSS